MNIGVQILISGGIVFSILLALFAYKHNWSIVKDL